MKPSETIVRTLARLNKSIVRKKPGKVSSKKEVEPETSIESREDVELLTEIADKLLAMGHLDIYDQEYEDLLSDLRDDGHVTRQWTPEHPLSKQRNKLVKWKYAWTIDGDEYGPFDTNEMEAWAKEVNSRCA
jgi:CD2 antigen cytoplasmic tail-binding protein 2